MSENSAERQRGQSIVIVAGALVVLVMFVAITVDVTDAYYHRRIAQNGADGAALAAAGELARQINDKSYSDTIIKIFLNDYGERNGIHDTHGALADFTNNNVEGYYLGFDGERLGPMVGGGYVPAGAWGVEAVTYITAPTWFGGVFGMDGYPISAEAAVVLGEACGVGCVLPIATHTETIKYPAATPADLQPCINIWNGVGPGNFGWLNWSWQLAVGDFDDLADRAADDPIACKSDDCSVPCTRSNLDPDNCNSGAVLVGDWAAGTTGVGNDSKSLDLLRYYIGHPGVCNDENDYVGPKCPSASTPVTFTIVVYGQGQNSLSGWIGYSGVITDGSGCGSVNLSAPSLEEGMHGQFYNVVGFARMRLLGYKLSQGDQHDPWIEPTECITMGEETAIGDPPNSGNRLTAVFLGWAEGSSGRCAATGTQYGLQFWK